MRARALFSNERGAAATEMALLVPLLLTLIFGGFEAGHFVWTQHKLAEAVRDGARFAARLPVSQLCDGDDSAMSSATETEIKLLTRTGQIASGTATPKVPGWTDAQVTVSPECGTFVSTGLYSELGNEGPIVTVAAVNVNYPSLFQSLGIVDSTFQLSARSNAAVIGL